MPNWCSLLGLLWLGLLAWGCGRPAPEPVAPNIMVPESLKPPPRGSPGPPLLTLAPPREPTGEAPQPDDEPQVAPRRPRPSGAPLVPPPAIGRCLRSRLCQLEGECSWSDDGRCIAGSDADCRGSWACKGWGRCDHDGAESCVAESAADCQASTRCQREGECSLLAGACVKLKP